MDVCLMIYSPPLSFPAQVQDYIPGVCGLEIAILCSQERVLVHQNNVNLLQLQIQNHSFGAQQN